VYVADSLIDVAVSNDEVERAVEIHVGKHTSEAQHRSGRDSHAGGDGDVFVGSLSRGTIETYHLVIEVGNGDSGHARVAEVPSVHAHAGARLSIGAKGNASLHTHFFEGAIAVVAIELVGLSVVGDDQVRPAVLVIVEQGDAQRF